MSWSVGSGKGTFAGIVAIAAGIAGLSAKCREVLDFCRFSRINFLRVWAVGGRKISVASD